MAQIKIEDALEHLDSEIKSALEAAVQEVMPGTSVDRSALFRAFIRAVRRKCSTWERVPDRFVKAE